jgi:hypothetical protein
LPETPAVVKASTRRSSNAADRWTAYAMFAAVPIRAVLSGSIPISPHTVW